MRKVKGRGSSVEGRRRARSDSRGSRKGPRRLSYGRRLRIEPLEERRMLAVVTVTTFADSVNFDDGVTSLREAIFATNLVPGADTINFAPSLTASGPAKILLTQGELDVTDSLEIDGPGADWLTIDASGNDPTPEVKNGDGSRIFDFNKEIEQPVDATIRGLTLTGGDASGSGGAIWAMGNLHIDSCVIQGNFAEGDGGGVYTVAGFAATPFTLINDSVITRNGAWGSWSSGGGIAIGGRYQQGGTAVIENCDIVGNTVTGTWAYGGGIYAGALDTIEILGSRVNQNLANGYWALGGGVAVDGTWAAGSVLVRDSEFSGNVANGDSPHAFIGLAGGSGAGGGLYIHASGQVEICGDRVTANQASGASAGAAGAAITDETGTVSFGENTWADNRVTSRSFGGGGSGGLNYALGLPATPGHYAINSQADELPGDFNFDGSVDAADYTVWRDSLMLPEFGVTVTQGDAIVGGFDPKYLLWKSHFGWRLNVCGNPDDEPMWDFSAAVAREEAVFSGQGVDNADAVVTVTTLADTVDFNDGVISLREAIFATNVVPGTDTINFQTWLTLGGSAKILLTQGELKIADDLTIDGPGADLLTVDASGSDPTPDINNGDGSRIFIVDDGNFADLVDVAVDGLTLSGGDANGDGGVIRSLENLAISQSKISGNAASADGGGISIFKGHLTLDATTINNNSSGRNGGAIYSRTGSVVAVQSTISGNFAARSGGGVYGYHSDVSVSNCAVDGNLSKTRNGGGIGALGNLVIADSSVSNNTCKSGKGGGIWVEKGNTTISGCTVSGNSGSYGGGVHSYRGDITITSSAIHGNTVTQYIPGPGTHIGLNGGGGVWVEFGNLALSGCVITGNSAPLLPGGGVYCGNLALDGSEISGNTAQYGGGLFFRGNSLLTDSTIWGNSSVTEGGGILCYGQVQLRRVTVTGNTAVAGGGICSLGGFERISSVFLNSSVVSGNTATASGGGIFSRSSNLAVSDCQIETNSANGKGGGIYGFAESFPNVYVRVTLSRSIVSGNTAGSLGGGMSLRGCDVSVTESVVSGNSATSGGGIYTKFGDLAVTDSTLSGNGATENGGGVLGYAPNNVEFSSSTISRNGAVRGGGGLYLVAQGVGAFAIRHSTVAENTARGVGGGIFAAGGLLTIDGSIVARNQALFGGDVIGLGGGVSARFSLIGTNSGTGLAQAPVGSPDSNGNVVGGSMYGTMIDPLLGQLANNGGPTLPDGSPMLTHALLPGSPAIDAGDPSAVAGVDGVPLNDERGAPFVRVNGGRIDMGAVESQPLPAPYFGDFNGDGKVDAADYTVWRDRMGSMVTPYTSADGDGSGMVDAADYEVWKNHFGETLAGAGSGSAEVGVRSGEFAKTALAEPVAPDAAGSMEQGAGSGEVGGKAEGGGGKGEVAFSSQLSALSQREVGRLDFARKVGVGSSVFTPGGQSPFSISASLGPTDVTRMGTDPGMPRPALGAVGVPRNGSAGASPSRFIGSSRDDSLLVWLAGRASSGEFGVGSGESGTRFGVRRKGEGGRGRGKRGAGDARGIGGCLGWGG